MGHYACDMRPEWFADDDSKRGLYQKYEVRRTDGSDKHKHCEYFVLDLNHDKHARKALKAYAKSCEKEYPHLAADLRKKLEEL